MTPHSHKYMKSDKKIRVLVLDADMVPALTIARSLAQRRCMVDVAGQSSNAITRHSNSVTACYTYPDPLSAGAEFLEWLVSHTSSECYDLVIPVTERTLVPIAQHREKFGHVKLAIPAQESLDVALDKARTLELATSLGVPVPGGFSLSNIEELGEHLDHLKYPVVLKPARSLVTNKGRSSQLKVSYAFDEVELRAGCEHGLLFGPMILQEYFKGQGVGIELIAYQGRVAYAFQHLRLHEVPLSGGGSSLRKSVPIEPKLLAASECLMSALGWNGVAMVEFKWNPETEEFSLMEINGRFWGSLPLADAAGADFPSMLLDLELEGEVKATKPYREGVYCRKLASDLGWYEAVLRSGSERQVADIPNGRQIFKELGLFFSPRHYFDVQSFRDPLPGLVDIGQIIADYYGRFAGLAAENYFLYKQKRAWRRGEVAAAMGKANSVLFVCYGNINRSALADVLSRGYLEDSGMKVLSAGFHQNAERPADPVMVDIAAANGVNLGQLRSSTVTPKLLHSSDIIFIMEKSHYDRLGSISAEVLGKTWLLGAHGGELEKRPEIDDPFGRSREAYEYCYNRIEQAVSHLKAMLVNRLSE